MTLGGSTLIRNGIEFDYNFRETIDCLCELCDKVIVVDAGSTDGTSQVLYDMSRLYARLEIVSLPKEDWDAQHGREKLSHFSNIAIQRLNTDWNFYLQCDEVIHEKSFPSIRQAIEMPFVNAFLVRRWNLWKDSQHILNVMGLRKPCSTEVIRLARPQFGCVGDAESLGITEGIVSIDFLNKIEIFHMGFVRKLEAMKPKIHEMQVNVFEMANHDAKLDRHDLFKWDDYFDESDLISLEKANKTLPKFIQNWASTRP